MTVTAYLNIFPEERKFPAPKGGVGLSRMTGLAWPDLTMLDLTAFILSSFSSVAPNRKLSSLNISDLIKVASRFISALKFL